MKFDKETIRARFSLARNLGLSSDDAAAIANGERDFPEQPLEATEAEPAPEGGVAGPDAELGQRIKAAAPPEPAEDLATLRERYKEATGKQAYHAWDEDTLRAKIAAASGG